MIDDLDRTEFPTRPLTARELNATKQREQGELVKSLRSEWKAAKREARDAQIMFWMALFVVAAVAGTSLTTSIIRRVTTPPTVEQIAK